MSLVLNISMISNCFHRKTRRTQRCFFLFFAVDPPKIPADRKDGKELKSTFFENNLSLTCVEYRCPGDENYFIKWVLFVFRPLTGKQKIIKPLRSLRSLRLCGE